MEQGPVIIKNLTLKYHDQKLYYTRYNSLYKQSICVNSTWLYLHFRDMTLFYYAALGNSKRYMSSICF